LQGRVGVLLISVRDFPKMLEFYRDKMGLRVSSINPGEGYESQVDWVRFEFDEGTALELFAESKRGPPKDVPFPRLNAIVIAFQVDDIEATYRESSSRCLQFVNGIGTEERGRYVHFRDPEGKRRQLYQPTPATRIESLLKAIAI
jgi:catechol 2,3-dioxygenase-like lactoylglutathione lyase family enzyme